MVTLILVVCLTATPNVCREEHPPVDVSLMSCQIEGQMIARDWLDDHPKWLLRGWRCRFGNPERAS